MARADWVRAIVVGSMLSAACDGPPAPADGGDAGAGDPPPPALFAEVEETARYRIPELSGHAHVVRTEMNVPHVYAENRLDAMRVLGFVMAQDRFFQMDMTRRLSQGRLSEILGDAALPTDIENRQIGAAHVARLYEQALSEEEAAEVDAFAQGINAYIEAVRMRQADPPKEYAIAAGLLGARRPVDLMVPWTRADVVATGATVLYSTSFETGDVGRAAAFDRYASTDDHFPGMLDSGLREAGLERDIIGRYAPPNDSSSAAGWGLETGDSTRAPIVAPAVRRPIVPSRARVERGVLERLAQRLERVTRRWHRDGNEGYGSNAWAVMGSATTDGSALLAGDGHLQLSVPSLFWQFGLDTILMGGEGEDTRLMGATIPGLPLMGVGTNGRIAWTQTAYFADVTDWYREEIVLDETSGEPVASMFRGEARPLTRVDETFEIRDVPLLESEGRTEVIPRWVTFDGRFITSIEGRSTTEDEPLGPGEARVNMMGEWIVPSDTDGDGRVTAISFYYAPFAGGSLLRAFRKFSLGHTVEDFRQAMRHFIGYGGSMIAADSEGSVLYSAYHAVPCRDYLPRNEMNVWIDGADPRRLIDGTQYPAWSIPLDAEGRVDEAAAAAGGPERCAVPFDEWPQALNPARQYVHHANNDPGHIATDNDLFDDPYYIGGPWIEGYRARRIEQRLQAAIAEGRADVEEMARIQGDHHSNLGEDFAPLLLEVIAAARDAAAGTPDPGSPEERMAARWAANQAVYEEVERRIAEWRDAGYPTPSGVETFYSPAPTDAEREAAVATTIFNHWFPRFIAGVLGDEGIDRALSPAVTGDTYTMQTIDLLVRGRGEGNPLGLASWKPETQESVFFDDVTTPEVESSQEIGLRALDQALEWLRSPPTAPDTGGFGTDDMSQWLWGLRHHVRFESLLADFLGDQPGLSSLLDLFSITTERLPLAESIPAGDPREGQRWFPRPGDQFDVDAANPGLDGETFGHGSGPVFRMVIALGPSGVRGQNIVPGGQSGNPDSEHFADQVRLWLANETLPMRYLPEEVAEGAVSRQRFVP